MRHYTSLDCLISPLHQRILVELMIRRRGPLYRGELAKRMGVTPSTLLRPLQAMTRDGILVATIRGREVNYEANPACPFLPELRRLLLKTGGLLDVVRAALSRHHRTVAVAFVYGSFASGSDAPDSDVDLLVVGDVTLSEITPDLHAAEQALGRPVNVRLLSEIDLREKLAAGNHFLTSVLDKPKIFVVGTEYELGKIAGREPSGAPPVKPGGAGRAPGRRGAKSRPE